MSTIIHLLRGQMSSPVNHLGGRCPHIPFFTGGQMSEGVNVRLPHVLCTTTEENRRLEVSDLGSRGIILHVAMQRKQRHRSAAQ